MKVYLIHPKAPPTIETLSEGLRWWGVDANIAPRDLPLLAALTPPEVELELADQQAGDPIDFEKVADLVVLVARAEQIPGLRYLAGRFRARRIPVVLAGEYVSQFPHRVDFVDIKLVGELETLWPQLLEDRQKGVQKKEYLAAPRERYAHDPLPRWDLLTLSRYRMAAVEVSRPGLPEAPGLPAPAPVRVRPSGEILEEIGVLAGLGVNRIWLEADDLLADPASARTLLETLAEINATRTRKLKFEARVRFAGTKDLALLELMARANVRRVELELNLPEVPPSHVHEDPTQSIEAVRRLHEQGIRVVGRLTLCREGETAHGWDTEAAVARESHAIPWPRAARALPGTELYEMLQAAGRLIQGGRDAELRQELFEAPNFHPAADSREAQLERLKQLILELFSCGAIEGRLLSLFREARRGPLGDLWPAREELRALVRMAAGTFQNPGEERLRLVARAAMAVIATRPAASLVSQGLEQLLEEAATRSFVLKLAQERPLDAAVPVMTLKQRAVGMGAKLVGTFASRRM